MITIPNTPTLLPPGNDPGGSEHILIQGQAIAVAVPRGPTTPEDKFIEYANGDAGHECCEQWFRDICTFLEHRQAIANLLRDIANHGLSDNCHTDVETRLYDRIKAMIVVCRSAGDPPNPEASAAAKPSDA